MTAVALQYVLLVLSIFRSCCSLSLSNNNRFYQGRGSSFPCSSRRIVVSSTVCMADKGFGTGGKGGGGFGAKKSGKATTATEKPSREAIAKNIQKKYGGTTSSEIAIGTQKRIEESMMNLPVHLQVATRLYQQLQRWNARLANMSILQQANIPQPEIDGSRRAQLELDRICQENDVTMVDLHNIFQRITWDASADAKAARSLTGVMPPEIAMRVDSACKIIVDAVKQSQNPNPRCLDVGCGFGVLVPHLIKDGRLSPNQIFGVDLSSEMIRNARAQNHHAVRFEAADFLEKYIGPTDDDGMFDGIIFCSSLHDLPDPIAALRKAGTLLRSHGKIVVVHPQGSAHVNKQVESNPVLVKRGLPEKNELLQLAEELGLSLEIEPASPNTPADIANGYLTVLQKK